MNFKDKKSEKVFTNGDLVRTKKGGRLSHEGPFRGVIVKFATWREYDAAIVKKESNGRKVLCLLKNLEKLLP